VENIAIDAIDTDFSIVSRQHEVVMEAMIIKTSTPLYEGSSTSMLAAMLLLLNLRTVHGVNNVFMDEFFSLLRKELLPKGNKMLVNTYEAFKLIKTFGLSYG
jgi:hypothetical protein